MRRWLIASTLVGASAAPAAAKYQPPYVLGISPRFDGHIRDAVVPRNVQLWVASGSSPLGSSYRLLGDDVHRALVAKAPHIMSIARLDPGLLEPDRGYTLVDEASGGVVTRFVTSTGEDHVPPRPPRIRSLSIVTLTDPWTVNDIAMEVELSDDTLVLGVTVTDSSVHGTEVGSYLTTRRGWRLLGLPFPDSARITPGGRTCFSIRAIDLAGNASAPATRCTTARAASSPTAFEAFVQIERYGGAASCVARTRPPRDERGAERGSALLLAIAWFLGSVLVLRSAAPGSDKSLGDWC